MGFSAPFIARPIATILLSLGLLLAGVVAYRFLPVAALPSVDIPTIVVIAARPGADPETMANSVAAPLERRLGEISGVTEITSTSSIGNTSVVVQFDIDRDINGAAHDVQAAINAAITDLPSDLPTRPYYRKFNPADAPIMTLALSSDTLTDRTDLRRRRQHPGAAAVAGRGRLAGHRERRREARRAGAARPGAPGRRRRLRAGRVHRDPRHQRAAADRRVPGAGPRRARSASTASSRRPRSTRRW